MASNRVPPVGGTTASTSSAGIVQLTDSTSSTSTSTAATPNSVKNVADASIPKTLTTTTGDLIYASAANTPARLGVGSTGQVLTVSGGIPAWVAPVSDPTFCGVMVKNSTDFSIPGGVNTTLTWDQEIYDTDNFHSTTTNTNRLTVPSGKAGYYFVYAWGMWTGTPIAQITQILIDNQSNEVCRTRNSKPTNDWVSVWSYHVRYMNVGDYVTMSVYQGSASSMNWSDGGSYGSFGMYRIGA